MFPASGFSNLLSDTRTDDFIDRTDSDNKVLVDDQTGDNLKGGSRKITGLKANRYYMVEKELNEEKAQISNGIRYVTDKKGIGPGGLTSRLGEITWIYDGEITGLTNKNTYTVRAAVPVDEGIRLSYTDTMITTPMPIDTQYGGVITIQNADVTTTLNISALLKGKTYDVIAVLAVQPDMSDWTSPWNWQTRPLTAELTLEGQKTTVDYVFVEVGNPLNFQYFRVVRSIGSGNLEAEIKIDFNITDESPDLDPVDPFYLSNFGNGEKVTIKVNGNFDSVEWSLNGNPLPGRDLVLTNDKDAFGNVPEYMTAGKHTFIVTVTTGGKPYSKNFTIVVVDDT
jgi:hypothetical protein